MSSDVLELIKSGEIILVLMSNQVKSIAVLITCHNRVGATQACLASLLSHQENIQDLSLTVYLADAGSTDGTIEMVRECFPEVKLACLKNNQFWCSSMRLLFAKAMQVEYDYYLWLNDDVTLFPDAIDRAFKATCLIKKSGIIIGSTCDSSLKKRTYGGLAMVKPSRPLSLAPVIPTHKPEPCDTINGNFVLIPQYIALRVGNLSHAFLHAMGDTDYGFRAKSLGVDMWVMPGFVGICELNPPPRWSDINNSLIQRYKALQEPKGLPLKEWYVFSRRHAGVFWLFYWVKPLFRVCFPRLFS